MNTTYGLSASAIRKRVSRIERRMAKGQPVNADEAAIVEEYRRAHRKYRKGNAGIARDMRISDDEAMRQQLEAERLSLEWATDDAPTGQTPASDAPIVSDVSAPVGDSQEIVTEVQTNVTALADEVMENVTTQAGVCPVCRAGITDGQLRCGKCGANVRPDLCPKCRDPYGPDEKFCKRDGTPRPTASAAVVTINKQGQPAIVDEPLRMWDVKNTRWLMDAIDLGLEKGGMDKLDDDERKQLLSALVPVLNKQLPASGKWAEEIRLGVVCAGVFFPRFYIRWVIMPSRAADERRKEEIHRAELARMQVQTEAAKSHGPVTVDVKAGK